MPQSSADQTLAVIQLVGGAVVILGVLLQKRLLRLFGQKPWSELFTTPRFGRSAKITEKLGSLLALVFGMGWLITGAVSLFWSVSAPEVFYIAWLGLAGLIVLGMIGITLVNWKA